MTHDTSHYGGSNGSGGRFNDSVAQIVERQTAEADIRRKAAEDPRSLTEEDLALLPGDLASDLMARGELARFGLGRKPKGRRH